MSILPATKETAAGMGLEQSTYARAARRAAARPARGRVVRRIGLASYGFAVSSGLVSASSNKRKSAARRRSSTTLLALSFCIR